MQKTMELGLSQNDGSGLMPEVINGKVDARGVHEALEITTRFDDWFRRRVEEFGFVEGEDFSSNLTKTSLGRPRTDFALSLDMAKELAMVERNEMGRKMRRYFIECEKRLHHSAPQPAGHIPTSTLLKLQEINAGVISELGHQQERIAKLESHMRPGPDWLCPAEWLENHGYPRLHAGRLAMLSRVCTTKSGAENLPVGRVRRQGHEKRSFAPQILDQVVPIYIERWMARDQEAKGGAA